MTDATAPRDSYRNRPVLVMVASHWLSMIGLFLVATALITWLFVLPLHVRGRVANPYIGIVVFEGNTKAGRFIIDQLNERLWQFVGLAQRDRLLDPNARVALSLASLFNAQLSPGIQSALVISQEEIAELAGLSRQRTNEALKFLSDRGLLRTERVGITILDLKGLQNFKA